MYHVWSRSLIHIFIVYSAFSYYGQIGEGPRHKLGNLIAWFYLEAVSIEKKKKGGKEKEKTHSTLQLSLHYENSGTLSSYIANLSPIPPRGFRFNKDFQESAIWNSSHSLPLSLENRENKMRWKVRARFSNRIAKAMKSFSLFIYA